MASDLPIQLYRHIKTGNIYQLIENYAEIEATGVKAVVYRSIADNRVWVRPRAEFNEKFVHAGSILN